MHWTRTPRTLLGQPDPKDLFVWWPPVLGFHSRRRPLTTTTRWSGTQTRDHELHGGIRKDPPLQRVMLHCSPARRALPFFVCWWIIIAGVVCCNNAVRGLSLLNSLSLHHPPKLWACMFLSSHWWGCWSAYLVDKVSFFSWLVPGLCWASPPTILLLAVALTVPRIILKGFQWKVEKFDQKSI